MKIEDKIRYWADCVIKEMTMLNESNTPHDEDSINRSFSSDVSDEKFVPTDRFIRQAYIILREKLFDNGTIPDESKLQFIAKSQPRKSAVGCAGYRYYPYDKKIIPIHITLNSALTLTLHEWLEVVLHEMVHVCDYVTNPNHFMGFESRYYDSHGRWFLDYGKQFEKYGFNVQKYCNADIKVNTDDRKVGSILSNSVFMVLHGMKNSANVDPITRISQKNVQKYIDFMQRGVDNGRYEGLERLIFYKSNNPNIIKIPELRMKTSHSTMRYYPFNDKFKEAFGPFEEMQEVMINHKKYNLAEDRDEGEYDDMNHIDDEYARKMYDNIDGIVGIKKNDDGSYDVDIF